MDYFEDKDIKMDTQELWNYRSNSFKEVPCRRSNFIFYKCPNCNEETHKKKDWLRAHSKDVYPSTYPSNYLIYCYNCKKKFYTETTLDKRVKTWKDKYGVDNPAKKEEVRAKIKETFNSLTKEEKEERENKRKRTCRERYGVDNPFENKQILDKRKTTWKNKYGVENIMNCPDIVKKSRVKGRTVWHYKYDNRDFDSSWELQYYKYLKDNEIEFTYKPAPLEYEFDNQTHLYFPDFLVEGEYIEIKGDHLLKDGKLQLPIWMHNDRLAKKYEEKQKCMDYYKVLILSKKGMSIIIKENTSKYGKDWYIKYRVRKDQKR